MDRSIDRHGRMNVANPTFEEMARHWFDTFGTNPSVESIARSCSWFELPVGGAENIWLITGVALRPHTPMVTWRYITFGDGGQG
jgi:hypothetical protein